MPALTIREKLTRYPPVLCRLLARTESDPVRALTIEELQTRSGLSRGRIVMLSELTAWDAVSVADMLAFSTACGVDFNSRAALRRQDTLLRKNRGVPRHLHRSPDWNGELRHLAEIFHNAP